MSNTRSSDRTDIKEKIAGAAPGQEAEGEDEKRTHTQKEMTTKWSRLDVGIVALWISFITDRATAGDRPVLLSSKREVTGPSSTSISSPEGVEFGYTREKKKSTRSTHYPAICPTDTSVCMCVWGVKASCLHSCLGVATLPPFACRVLRPGPVCAQWNPTNQT